MASVTEVVWFTTSELAARWKMSSTSVRKIPLAELRYKSFGRGKKFKHRKYREDWVVAFEEATEKGTGVKGRRRVQ